ncbi:MAG: prolyl oligopeptidase [Bacteroidia bacterium]|jgi:prolyl oligopeptidase
MKISSVLFFVMSFLTGYAQSLEKAPEIWPYPKTKEISFSYNRFGEEVNDPYHWMASEQGVSDFWIYEQNDLTNEYFKKVKFKNRIKTQTDFFGSIQTLHLHKRGKYYFRYLLANTGITSASIFYREYLDSEDIELINPRMISKKGWVDFEELFLSKNERFLAFSYSLDGSPLSEIQIMDFRLGKRFDDKIKHFSYPEVVPQESGFAWRGNGFFYTKWGSLEYVSSGAENTELDSALLKNDALAHVYYHRLGTPQTEDSLVFVRKGKPELALSVFGTQDERFVLIIETNLNTDRTTVYINDSESEKKGLRILLKDVKGYFRFLEHIDGRLLMITDAKAEKPWLAYVDPNKPNELIPALKVTTGNAFLKNAYVAGEHIICVYEEDAIQVMTVFETNGSLIKTVWVEGGMSFAKFMGQKGDSELFVKIESKMDVASYGIYNLDDNKFVSKIGTKHSRFKPSDYVFERHMQPSHDGVSVPVITIRHKKHYKEDGTNPTLLNVYGGYGISKRPYFDPSIICLLEAGGVYAEAHVRGGGELGPNWHNEGKGLNKGNTVKDLIAAAEFLIDSGFTNSDYLAISGASHGGFVVGSAMVERPDLFKAVIPLVGVFDFIEDSVQGFEYGFMQDSLGFLNRLNLSAYHNLKVEDYPSTLFITSASDNRVPAGQSYKMVARMQQLTGMNPALLWNLENGHQLVKTWDEYIALRSRILAFMFNEMNFKPKEL